MTADGVVPSGVRSGIGGTHDAATKEDDSQDNDPSLWHSHESGSITGSSEEYE